MILLENPKLTLDGQKLKEDKTSLLKVDQIFQFLLISKEPSLNLRMNSSQEVTKSSLLEIKDNNLIEDYFFSNTKLKDFLKEELISQSKIKKVDIELWITVEFLMKKKIKLCNWKKKFKILRKDLEEPQKENLNLKNKSLD